MQLVAIPWFKRMERVQFREFAYRYLHWETHSLAIGHELASDGHKLFEENVQDVIIHP